MSELKSFYVEQKGYDYNKIENSLWYLSELSLRGAMEMDDYILGKNHSFTHVQELMEILKKYQLKDTDTALTEPQFPYLPLWRTVIKDSNKKIKSMSELALEMRLLRLELENIPNNKKLKELRSVLCDFSEEFSNEYYRSVA